MLQQHARFEAAGKCTPVHGGRQDDYLTRRRLASFIELVNFQRRQGLRWY